VSGNAAAQEQGSIQQLLAEGKIRDIGVLPEVVANINRMAEDPNVNAEQVAGLILRDPALTSKVLRIINSSFYGLRQEIRSVQHAVAYLGIHQVRNLVICSALIESFRFDHGVVDPRSVWEHSLACAIGAKRLGDMLPGIDGDGTYLGGLLHDLGRIILLAKLPNSYAEVVNIGERGLCTLREAEESRFGMHHDEIGYTIGRSWGFAEPVLAMIRYHHCPAEAERYAAQAAVISLSNSICHREELGYGFEVDHELALEEGDRAWEQLQSEHPAARKFQRDAVEEVVTESVAHTRALVADLF
jgi:HD-like signal output (HDOD) protein